MPEFQLQTVDALLASYAAGMLPEPARVLVEAHLEMKIGGRTKAGAFEALLGQTIEEIEPVDVVSRDMALEAIFSARPVETKAVSTDDENGVFPLAIRKFIGMDAPDIPWKRRLPGFKEYDLGKIDGCDVSILHIRAGRTMPSHTHEGHELTLVLEGAFADTRGRYGKGDLTVADESVDHRPIAEKGGPCIAFAVCDAPLKLTGSIRQRLSDLIG